MQHTGVSPRIYQTKTARWRREWPELTVQNIHDQLDALDPATRAAVVARLTSDEVTKVHEHHQ